MNPTINVGVVGATGMVGEVFLELLHQRQFPFKNLKLFASENSSGQTRLCGDKSFAVEALKPNCFEGLDLVFFSSGDDISLKWAPLAVEAGAMAVDNSAAFRMSPEHALVVPEINSHQLPRPGKPAIIANPNCSTIQLVLMLKPLRDQFGLSKVKVATYQAVSGAGKAGIAELNNQIMTSSTKSEVFAHPIAYNCLPHIGSFDTDGFSSEEVKIMKETKKILDLPDLSVSAFSVRIPGLNSHSEAVWVTLDKQATKDEVIASLKQQPGVVTLEHSEASNYPHAVMASGTDPVYVGRIHKDLDEANTWLFWVVADNVRKGAALNGIQIAEAIFDIRKTI